MQTGAPGLWTRVTSWEDAPGMPLFQPALPLRHGLGVEEHFPHKIGSRSLGWLRNASEGLRSKHEVQGILI